MCPQTLVARRSARRTIQDIPNWIVRKVHASRIFRLLGKPQVGLSQIFPFSLQKLGSILWRPAHAPPWLNSGIVQLGPLANAAE
jgi:hypothetical protein